MNDLLFGYSNSSFQYEGRKERGTSIWDTFCRVPRKIKGRANGDVACGGFDRWEEDLTYLRDNKCNAYRFSISWARLMPRPGFVNPEAIKYYQGIIEDCRQSGIKTFATLYHWDMPQWIYDSTDRGWMDRKIVDLFLRYASVCFSFLDPDFWITINEPWCISYLGYYYGSQAPGLKVTPYELMGVIHNINLAHGTVVKAYRDLGKSAPIGISLNPYYAQSSKLEVQETAFDFETGVFTDPIFHGHYPKRVGDKCYFPWNIQEGDMEVISTPIDFYGINYYFENNCKTKRKFPFSQLNNDPNDGVPRNCLGWRIVPEGLLRILRRLNQESGGLPVYITENGYPMEGGDVHDQERINYVKAHVEVCRKAIEEGIPVKGYLQWSLTDNFEWRDGYGPRFGGIHIDYETQERTVKDSMKSFWKLFV